MLQTEICHWFLFSFLTFFSLVALLVLRISWLFFLWHWRFYWSRSTQHPADISGHCCCDFAFSSVFDLTFTKNWGRLPGHRLHTEPVPEAFEDSSLLASALDSLLAAEASSFPWYSVGKRGPASWECFRPAKNIFYEFILFRLFPVCFLLYVCTNDLAVANVDFLKLLQIFFPFRRNKSTYDFVARSFAEQHRWRSLRSLAESLWEVDL